MLLELHDSDGVNCFSDWTVVTVEQLVDLNIDNGLIVKVAYVQNQKNKVVMIFNGMAAMTINIWDGNFQIITQNCHTKDLSLSTIKDSVSFIMTIYRRDKQIIVDIDGENKVELDTSSPPDCSSFWGAGEINKVYFAPAADRNAATRYRILGDDDDNDDDGADDAGGLTHIKQFVVYHQQKTKSIGNASKVTSADVN